MNRFQTTLNPNPPPKKFYKYFSVAKREETGF